VGRLAAFGLFGLFVSGCWYMTPSVTPSAAPTAPEFDVRIDTPDGPAGLVRNGESLDLYLRSSDGGTYKVTTAPRGDPPTVHLLSMGGETGRQTNSFVFGDAPVGATAVVVNGIRAAVSGELYVVALSTRELLPDAVVWSFLGPDEAVLVRGSGIRN
jgi:hypothetical protein